jgi:lipopolysaccharide/colanic/teichoic acid biosynthesis glycosyltransferase
VYPVVKKCIDVVGAGLGLIVLSPVLAVVAIAVCMQMGRPVLFRQMRSGLFTSWTIRIEMHWRKLFVGLSRKGSCRRRLLS